MNLLIAHSAPDTDTQSDADSAARDLADMALTLAAFAQPVTVLFSGAGVRQLARGGDPDLSEQLLNLPEFGVECVAEAEALADWPGADAPLIPVTPLSASEVQALMHQATQVWGW
ncbi:MAG: DsrE family protein [Alcanivorax sp.]|nr:DsrE family protein [Alcanivorax sp.]